MQQSAGAFLVAASAMFWLSWMLMPGVGVSTDAATIFALVGANRSQRSYRASVVLQLAAASGVRTGGHHRRSRPPTRNLPIPAQSGSVASSLRSGAMGSAADAIFHLVAYEMTGPGVASGAMVPVMTRLQGLTSRSYFHSLPHSL